MRFFFETHRLIYYYFVILFFHTVCFVKVLWGYPFTFYLCYILFHFWIRRNVCFRCQIEFFRFAASWNNYKTYCNNDDSSLMKRQIFSSNQRRATFKSSNSCCAKYNVCFAFHKIIYTIHETFDKHTMRRWIATR